MTCFQVENEAELQVFISDFQVLWELANKEKKIYNIKNMYAYLKQEQSR